VRLARTPLAAYSIPRPVRRSRPLKRQAQPDSMRLFYFAQLRALMAEAHARVTAELVPLVHDLRDRKDATDEERVRATVQRIAREFQRELTPNKLAPLAVQVARRTADFQKRQLVTQIKDAIAVTPFLRDSALGEQVAEFTRTNVALIKTVPERYFASLETKVAQDITDGARATTIAKDIEERYGVAESDAARIANDQVGKFFGAVNQTRQEELGIAGYIWRTVEDNRVRHGHQGLDGTSQDWNDPPEGGGTDENEPGHPGSGICCRCFAEPDLSGLLG
jgi:SPP1 gp7 family putative phage head morphogenesis protein